MGYPILFYMSGNKMLVLAVLFRILKENREDEKNISFTVFKLITKINLAHARQTLICLLFTEGIFDVACALLIYVDTKQALRPASF